MKIGCIGQGFVGKNIADYLDSQGHNVVRYSLEPEYIVNKSAVASCDLVFVAVPTPSSSKGFDDSNVQEAIELIKVGGIAVIKSTVLPGTANRLQKQFPDKIIISSPEFLSEVTAAYDVTNPIMQIIGLTEETNNHRLAADRIVEVMPKVKNNFIVAAKTAELFKYKHNVHGYFRIILTNLLFDVSEQHDEIDWLDVERMAAVDPMMSPYYNTPVHKGGRGAGGNCFIKDMAAFRSFYEQELGDEEGLTVLRALETKNISLLQQTGKDAVLLKQVYGIEDGS